MSAPSVRAVVTAAVADWAAHSPERSAFSVGCLRRHLAGDWGDLDHQDWAVNDRSVQLHSGRVLSNYRIPDQLRAADGDGQLWIITDDLDDPDTATTLLFPRDY
ncbi:MAG: hypothetical protein QM733_04420 [Ilumatobacteraceae bacterium]